MPIIGSITCPHCKYPTALPTSLSYVDLLLTYYSPVYQALYLHPPDLHAIPSSVSRPYLSKLYLFFKAHFKAYLIHNPLLIE